MGFEIGSAVSSMSGFCLDSWDKPVYVLTSMNPSLREEGRWREGGGTPVSLSQPPTRGPGRTLIVRAGTGSREHLPLAGSSHHLDLEVSQVTVFPSTPLLAREHRVDHDEHLPGDGGESGTPFLLPLHQASVWG